MKLPRTIWSRTRSLFQRCEVKREIDEELRFHIESRTRENIAAGMSPEDAVREARKRFGNVQGIREECREHKGASFGETLWQDVRFGVRVLGKSPGFTTVAVLSLALGIGAGTAIFSLVNGILLSSLPVPNPQDLRVITWSGLENKTITVTGSYDNDGGRAACDSFMFSHFTGLREKAAGQADIFGFTELRDVSVRVRNEPFIAEGLMVSDNFFSALDVRPVVGKVFQAGDDDPSAAPMVLISYDCWEKHFNHDPAVIGQSVTLNTNAFTVVGVLPREFRGVGLAEAKEFYVPMSAQPQLMPAWSRTSTDRYWVHLMARLKPGVKPAQLKASLDVLFAAQVAEVMKTPKIEIRTGRAGPAYDRKVYQKPLLVLLGVVAVVILVACANLAGLSLARGTARLHEFAIRAAVGAGRWRLIRQSLTESVLVALLGGGLGAVIAVWGKEAISRLLAGSADGLHYDTSLDLKVLGFTLAMALVTALLSGLLPALRAGSVDPLAGLKERGALGTPRLRAGRALVVAQIALTLLLVAGAALYTRTLVNLVHINPGFKTEKLLLFQLNPRDAGLRGPAITQFYERAQDSIAGIPGVQAVALEQFKLLGGWMSGGGGWTLPSHPELDKNKVTAHRLTVGETFFSTLEIPVLQGRGFTAADTDTAAKVVVVNEAFIRKYLPNDYPIGQIFKQGKNEWQIVGVCGDAKYNNLKLEVPPTVYHSFRQTRMGSAYFAVRTALPPLALVPAVRKAVMEVDPNIPLSDITTQEQVRDRNISHERLFATLCSALAMLTVLLSCIGLYGLMAYNVARRTGEIGIRMALGATRQHIAGPILREALWLAILGVAVGVPVALGLMRLIKSQLYGVAATDPLTLTGAGILLLQVALLSAWIPARRAAKVDPIVALRCE